jgi:tetratricopeptide (TPR) repeat protein
MRRLLACAATVSSLCGCADWAHPPLMAGYDAHAPLVQEQAPIGFDAGGNAASLQLVDAEGRPPDLDLVVFDARGGPTRLLERAPAQVAAAVAAEVRARGAGTAPLLRDAAGRSWPEAIATASARGFAALEPQPEALRWTIPGPGGRVLWLRVLFDDDRSPASFSLLLGAPDAPDEIELARQTVVGTRIAPRVWVSGAVAWLLSGSIAERDPLRRMLGLRRGSLSRGEAALHDAAGRKQRLAGNLEGARRQFDLAVAADPSWFDGLYDAAATAAAAGRIDDALALLHRAAKADPRRIQVVGRDDDDLRELRRRADVRALLGMKRPPPTEP